jgi:hypothetical protein
MRPFSIKKRRILFYICLVCFVVLSSAVFLYSQGYAFDKGFSLSRRGGLYILAPFPDAEFFVNNKKEKATGISNNAIFIPNLRVGEYSVLVAKEGYWPWAKTLEVKEGHVAEARAFGVLEDPEGERIFKGKFVNIWGSPEQDIMMIQEQKNDDIILTFYMPGKGTFLFTDSAFSTNVLSSVENVSNILWGDNSLTFKKNGRFVRVEFNLSQNSLSADYISPPFTETLDNEKIGPKKEQKIWWNEQTNEVFIDWLDISSVPPYYICETEDCELPVRIFNTRFEIKNIDFFPKRNDVIIMAVGVGIYALEIDGRSGRLIYPIYKGGNPTFTLVEDEVFVLDNGSLMKIYLK